MSSTDRSPSRRQLLWLVCCCWLLTCCVSFSGVSGGDGGGDGDSESSVIPTNGGTTSDKEVLLINVLAILPGKSYSEGEVVMLNGKDDITVVFDRAVIALGQDWSEDGDMPQSIVPFELQCDVPGKIRWVTTSIARFTPDMDWPPDLHFTFRVLPIVSFDGLVVSTASIIYYTKPLTFEIENVKSAKAMELTDNNWVSSTPRGISEMFDTEWEVPPDGEIYLRFSSDISVSSVTQCLVLVTASSYPNDIHPKPFTTTECDTNSKNCIIVLPQNLEVGLQYMLLLPTGSKSSPYSGETTSDVFVKFFGLFEFRFPFLDHLNPGEGEVMYRNLNLYLRHSLSAGAELMESVMSISPPIHFSVLNITKKYMITLSGDFMSAEEYTLTIAANNQIIDGFSLPLLSSSVSFTTSKEASFIIEPNDPNPVFETFSQDWVIYSRHPYVGICSYSPFLSVVNVSPDHFPAAWASLKNDQYSYVPGTTKWEIPSTTPTTPVPSLNVTRFPTESLFGETGLWLKESWTSCSYQSLPMKQSTWIMRSNLSVSVLKGKDLLVWITRMDKNEVVEGASVKIYGIYSYRWLTSPENVILIGSGTTDSKGVWTFNTDSISDYFTAIALIEKDSALMVSSEFFIGGNYVSPNYEITEAQLILDRGFYKPGDKLYIKGYVRRRESFKNILLPTTMDYYLSIYWSRDDTEPTVYPVKLNPYGALNVTLVVPLNATLQESTLSLITQDRNYCTSAQVLVSQPRVPTTTLSLTSIEKIFRPNKMLSLSIDVGTYTGHSIANANVKLRWTLQRQKPHYWLAGYYYGFYALESESSSVEVETGEISLVTDQHGNVVYNLSLNDLEKPPVEGNTLILKAEYFSPTKELVTSSLELPVSYSSYLVSLKPTAEGDLLPEYLFGVFVAIQDVTKSDATQEIPGVNVRVDLYEWDGVMPVVDKETGYFEMNGELVKQCKFESVGGGVNPACTFSLPQIGKYLLVASLFDPSNYRVTSFLPVGKTLKEWENDPLRSWNGITMMLDKPFYTIPSTATLSFYNPFPRSLLLARWGNHPLVTTTVTDQREGGGPVQLSIPLGDECDGSCTLDVVLVSPRSPPGTAPVPTSLLFDPNAPTTITRSFKVTVKSPANNVVVVATPDSAVVEPGKRTGVTVKLLKDDEPTSGEVCVFVVDKAVLDLVSHPVVLFNESLAYYDKTEYFSVFDSRSNVALEKGFVSVKEILERRLRADPWIREEWPLRPSFNVDYVDVSDESFFSTFSSSLTYFPNGYSPFVYRGDYFAFSHEAMMSDTMFSSASTDEMELDAAPPLPSAARFDGGAGGATARSNGNNVLSASSSPSSSPAVVLPPFSLRRNFVTTPYFLGSMIVGKSGEARVEFNLPDNIGTFEVRVYAIDEESAFGVTTTEIISRKLFSLQSSAPSIVRNGDRFETGVTITINDESFSDSVIVSVSHVCELLELIVPSEQTLTLNGTGPHLVNFQFQALGTGEAQLVYTVKRKEKIEDAAVYTQDLRGQQEPVFIATSFSITDGKSDKEAFGLPSSVAYSGTLSLSAGVGRLPAITYFSNYARQQFLQTLFQYPSSDIALANVASYIALSPYGLSSTVYSWLEEALMLLKRNTQPNIGLLMYSGLNYPYTNTRLQALGVYVLRKGSNLQGIKGSEVLLSCVQVWEHEMWNSLASSAQSARSVGGLFNDFDLLALAYLASGSKIALEGFYLSQEDIEDLSFARLVDQAAQMSMYGKSILALILTTEEILTDTATILLTEIKNTFRVQGSTAYITDGNGADPSFVTSAVSLSAFTYSGETLPLVEKLANFVAQEGKQNIPNYCYYYYSSEQMIHSLFSLSLYDTSRGNTSPNLDVTVQSGSVFLLNATFTHPTDQPASSSLFFEDLPVKEDIRFTAKGIGEASVLFGARFIPLEINEKPISRGISVSKVIQLLDPATNEATGLPLTSATIGQQVKITIQINLPDYSSSVVIVDPFPGALEAQDEAIYDVGEIQKPFSNYYNYYYEFDYWAWYIRGSFSQKEFKKDKVVFYGENLFAGTHTVSYVALVNTNGEFVLPPTLAYDQFHPEVMGLSAGGKFLTKELPPSSLQPLPVLSSCLPWRSRSLVWSDIPSFVPRPFQEQEASSFYQYPPFTTPLSSSSSSSPSFMGSLITVLIGLVLLVLLLGLSGMVLVRRCKSSGSPYSKLVGIVETTGGGVQTTNDDATTTLGSPSMDGGDERETLQHNDEEREE